MRGPDEIQELRQQLHYLRQDESIRTQLLDEALDYNHVVAVRIHVKELKEIRDRMHGIEKRLGWSDESIAKWGEMKP